MSDRSLSMLLEEVRAKTLRRLEGLTPTQARWAPPGLQNTILWHAGHALIVVESLSTRALGQPMQTPEGWFELFSWDSRPGEIAAARWPTLETVVAELMRQRERLGAVIESLGEAGLDAPAADNPDRTVRYAILHGLHDEACHSGEMWLLRKLQAVSAPA